MGQAETARTSCRRGRTGAAVTRSCPISRATSPPSCRSTLVPRSNCDVFRGMNGICQQHSFSASLDPCCAKNTGRQTACDSNEVPRTEYFPPFVHALTICCWILGTSVQYCCDTFSGHRNLGNPACMPSYCRFGSCQRMAVRVHIQHACVLDT